MKFNNKSKGVLKPLKKEKEVKFQKKAVPDLKLKKKQVLDVSSDVLKKPKIKSKENKHNGTLKPDVLVDKDTTKKSINLLESKPNVKDATILKALEAITAVDTAAKANKNELFNEDEKVYIQVTCIKIPVCPKRKLRFALPHWLVTETSDICLFVSDLKRGSRVDHEPTIQHYEDMFREKGVTNIKTIIPIRQVRVEFDQNEMRRRLMTQYDFFLADAKVTGLLAHKLGKTFYIKNNLPTPVKLDRKDLKAEINRALHKTVTKIHGEGDTFALQVANRNHKPKQVCENIQAVLLQIAEQFPGGWENIRSVYVKYSRSMAIPIYLTLKNKNSVQQTTIKPLRPNDESVSGELSTILGGTVTVHRSGRVTLNVDKTVDPEGDSDDDVESSPAKKPKKSENKKKSASNRVQTTKASNDIVGNGLSVDAESDEDTSEEDESEEEGEKSDDNKAVENGTEDSEDEDDDDDNDEDDDDEDDDDDDEDDEDDSE